VTSTEHFSQPQQIDEGALIAGRYRLSRWLGLGAMGEVWAARDERLGRDVAVKLVSGGPQSSAESADRFTREAIAVARINHPNVVGVYDQGEHQRHHFVVMELITGCNLDELRGGRPMPVGAALTVAVQIARALEGAHEAGVVHRDIKPANIMVTHDGVVKVLDFGIAGFLQSGDSVTGAGESLGTPAYTAPERIAGARADVRSDLYSLGCVLYTMLTGLPPFPGEDTLTILNRQVYDDPTPVRQWRPEIPPEIDQLVMWLLSKDPTARPASAAVVAGRLESLATAYPTPNEGPEPTIGDLLVNAPEQGRNPRLAAREHAVAQMAAAGEGTQDIEDKPRRRRMPMVFLILSIIAGLVVGIVLSRQPATTSGAVGAMPSADAIHGGAPAASSPPAAGAPGTGMGAAAGNSSSGAGGGMQQHQSPATQMPGMAGGGGMAGGQSAAPQGTLSKVTPMAPVSPYLRYTAAVPGSGCVTLAPGQYECMIGRDGGAPVYQAGTLNQIGTVNQGDQPFYCQSSGGEYSHGGFSNHWWGWTEDDQGTFGWVSAVDIAGGSDNQPQPGLPYCGS
jgi:hypothetical protein